MSYEKEDLRRYADTWIIVITVFLTVTIAGVTFFPSQNPKHEEVGPVYWMTFVWAVISLSASIAIFLLARDPRQIRYSLSKMIDLGVACFTAGLFLISIGIGIRGYYLFGHTNDIFVTMPIIMISITIFFPILYYTIRKSKSVR